MASILGLDIGSGVKMPSFSFGGSSLTLTILILLVSVLVISLIVFLIWLWYQKKIYNKKVVIFENIGNQGYQKTGEDTARLIKVGDGGEEILYLRNRKVYRTAYGKKMGSNIYWFAVGQDGYWYNCTLGDLDAKMGMLDIEPVDRDMRYMHVAIRKNIQERYKKQGFMEKYGTMIIGAIFLIAVLILVWFLVDKISKLASIMIQTMQSNKDTLELVKEVLGRVDVINGGGSGYIQK
jgi:hypothetical protein